MRKVILLIFFSIAVFFATSPAFAQELKGIKPHSLESGSGKCVYDGGKDVGNVVTLDCVPVIIVNLLFWSLMFAGTIALFLIIFSGIKFITSGGDPKQVEGARKTAVWAIIGLVVILLSFAIVNLISNITGVECLKKIGFMICDSSTSRDRADAPPINEPILPPEQAPIIGYMGDEGPADRLECVDSRRVCEGSLCGCARNDGGKCYSAGEYCGPQRNCVGRYDAEGFIGQCLKE